MSRKFICVILSLILVAGLSSSTLINTVNADSMRRVIDNTHPMNMVSFYAADGETILQQWSGIPADLKPYSVILIVSEAKNTDACKNNITAYVSACQSNNIPCIVQAVNGETRVSEHIPVSWLETLMQNNSCLIGYNAAELYNSIGWYGEAEGNHSQYLADIINMVSLYGGFFVWTDTNIFGTNGTMIDWIQNNSNLIGALRTHKDNFIAMYKESYGSLNTDSLCLGLWLAGLASNWGISSDWWHWQVDNYTKLFVGGSYPGGWKQALTWPEELYVQSILRGMSEGAACFTDEAGFYSTELKGVQTPAFTHALMPFWSKIIDGTYTIPTRAEILSRNKFAYLGNTGYSVPYSSPYSNLYMTTGRYGIIPVIPSNCNATEQANFDNISTAAKSQAYFDSLYPQEVMYGNTFASRTGSQWYWMNSSENTNITQYSVIDPQINTSEYFQIQAGPHTSLVMKESSDKFTGLISNYRVNKDSLWDGTSWDGTQTINYIEGTYTSSPEDDTLRNTTITLRGSYSGNKPLLAITGDNGFTYSETFDSTTKVYTLSINHNGPVNFEITADGTDLPASVPVAVRVNDADSSIVKTPVWCQAGRSGDYMCDVHNISGPGYYQFTFTGTSIKWITEKEPNSGNANIYIDGVFDSTVSNYSATTLYQQVGYEKTGLDSGSHTIKVEWVSGNCILDAFEFTNEISASQVYTNDYNNNDITNLLTVKGSPTISAANGEVHFAGSSGDDFVIDNNSFSTRDCAYSFSMKPGANARCGGIIRYTDNNTYTWFGYENDGHWRIREVINGTSSGDIYLASNILSTDVFHQIKITANNKNIILTCDGQIIYNGLLNNSLPAVAGKIGFVGWSVVDAYFDNVIQNTVVSRAAGKVPTTSAAFTNTSRMTDGDKNTSNYMDSYPNNGLQWAQLDLGSSYDISSIKLWHYFGDTRSYHDVIVQLSNDSTFSSGVTTVFNNDINNSAGRGTGTDAEYIETSTGKNIGFSPVNARYIRFYSNGSTANASNHYVEAEVY